jgi:acyl-CoA synthetase (AMP-forming)/AMP-acid ligase II
MWIVAQDNYHELCPAGKTGELLVEGVILADGYLADAVKTNSVFLHGLRWAGTDPRRFYATGDLAYQDALGLYHYVGRKNDDEKKLNGVRISTSEIEGYIAKFLGIGSKVAVEVRRINNADVLVAFVALKAVGNCYQDAALRNMTRDIQAKLFKVLPSACVPSVFHCLRNMPLAPTGKMDQNALRSIDIREYDGSKKLDRTTPEAIFHLRSMWAQVLQVPEESLTTKSNFLACGGNSSLAMKLVRLARSQNIKMTV